MYSTYNKEVKVYRIVKTLFIGIVFYALFSDELVHTKKIRLQGCCTAVRKVCDIFRKLNDTELVAGKAQTWEKRSLKHISDNTRLLLIPFLYCFTLCIWWRIQGERCIDNKSGSFLRPEVSITCCTSTVWKFWHHFPTACKQKIDRLIGSRIQQLLVLICLMVKHISNL